MFDQMCHYFKTVILIAVSKYLSLLVSRFSWFRGSLAAVFWIKRVGFSAFYPVIAN